jgi:hypothetical protein
MAKIIGVHTPLFFLGGRTALFCTFFTVTIYFLELYHFHTVSSSSDGGMLAYSVADPYYIPHYFFLVMAYITAMEAVKLYLFLNVCVHLFIYLFSIICIQKQQEHSWFLNVLSTELNYYCITPFQNVSLIIWLITNSVVPQPEGSSPCSQEPTTTPYPEPGESNPHPSSQSL